MENSWTLSDNACIERICRYLRIKSVQPNPDYNECIKILISYADMLSKINPKININTKLLGTIDKPILLITCSTDQMQPDSEALLLLSHMDVVPVNESAWSSLPFEAKINEQGYIIARGVQDMKSVGMAYMEALGRVLSSSKGSHTFFTRVVHLLYLPDEEIGSVEGMARFVASGEFGRVIGALTPVIGLCLDEGVPYPSPDGLAVFNAERSAYWVELLIRGKGAGHGSTMPQGTAMERFSRFLALFHEYRAKQQLALANDLNRLGDIVSVNLTIIQAGTQLNVIPDQIKAMIDMRVPPVQLDKVDSIIQSWIAKSDDQFITATIINDPIKTPSFTDWSNKEYMQVLEPAIKDVIGPKAKIYQGTFTGATDTRFLRQANGSAGFNIKSLFNISPFRNTPIRLHDHDECLHRDIYLEGIRIYERIITRFMNNI